jgi:site-specific recombinase XerD
MYPADSIAEFEKYWRRRKPGTSTALHYSSDVRLFFTWAKDRSPDAITPHDVDRFVAWQQSLGRAATTITRRLIAVRMFYDYLAYATDREVPSPVVPRRHYLDRGRHLPRDVTDQVIQQLFAAIGNHSRDRCLFTLMLHAGLRVGELVTLQMGDVQVSTGGAARVRLLGKGRNERLVYLSATAAQSLAAYLATRPAHPSERIFLNQHGQPMTIAGVQWRLAGYCRHAGIWLTCHQLRHTFASRLVAADVPVTSVQKLLGHRSIRTTQLYVRIADTQVERDYHAGMERLAHAPANREVRG